MRSNWTERVTLVYIVYEDDTRFSCLCPPPKLKKKTQALCRVEQAIDPKKKKREECDTRTTGFKIERKKRIPPHTDGEEKKKVLT